jgi:hypothetical protein
MQIISTNTTWTAGQVINLTDYVQVAQGVTLTIEPGVIVRSNEWSYIEAFGTVNAIGRPDATIVFENVGLMLPEGRFERGHWNVDFADLINSALSGFAQAGGSFQLANSLVQTIRRFEGDFIFAPRAFFFYDENGTTLTRNAFVDFGTILGAATDNFVIRENLFVDTVPMSKLGASAIQLSPTGGAPIQIRENTFQLNGRAAIEVSSGSFGSGTAVSINASDNFFGASDPATLNALILDRNDSLSRAAVVTATPVLSAPDPDAPFYGVGSSNDSWVGSSANNRAWGNAGSDTFRGNGGDDRIEGGTGIDTALYSGNRANFVTAKTSSGFSVNDNSGTEGRDFLVGVERLRFSDRNVALDLDSAAGSTVKLLGTVIGAQAMTNLPLVGAVLSLFDSGFTVGQLSDAVVANGIMRNLIGSASNQAFVEHVYKNIVGAPPSPETSFALTQLLEARVFTMGEFLTRAAELPITASTIGLTGLTQTGLDFI